MNSMYTRRKFLSQTAAAGIGVGWTATAGCLNTKKALLPVAAVDNEPGKRIGIIGLDTSHSTAFVQALNKQRADPQYRGYHVVTAYPQGSADIKSSMERIPAYTEEVKKSGVRIVTSIPELLETCDVVMLETNDGRPHLEQASLVLQAGKKLFIDKPVAASLVDVLAIFELSEKLRVPVFSSSSLRYTEATQEAALGRSIGRPLGADTYSPCDLEKTHPDLFWYGIHGIEALFTVMGRGCKEVRRLFTESTDLVTGLWDDNRLGSFRGLRSGKQGYGGTAFGEKGITAIGMYSGYEVLLKKVIDFFETGLAPVSAGETIEIYAFMEAAEESKRTGGGVVSLAATLQKGYKEVRARVPAK